MNGELIIEKSSQCYLFRLLTYILKLERKNCDCSERWMRDYIKYYSATLIILALIFWGMLWGITGMLLAAPLTAIIRISFDQFEITKPISKILSGNIHHKV